MILIFDAITNTMPDMRENIASVARLSLAGGRYVILPEAEYLRLCRRAGVAPTPHTDEDAETSAGDPAALAARRVTRRQAAGLSQAELARRAGVRAETLNRVERGRTTPDFATIRKLAAALRQAEQSQSTPSQRRKR